MLRHFAHQHTDGSWHAAYIVPGTSAVASVVDCPSQQAAQSHADKLNADQERKARASAALNNAIENRPIPRGFYTDDDAR